jgi:hypothetical protein
VLTVTKIGCRLGAVVISRNYLSFVRLGAIGHTLRSGELVASRAWCRSLRGRLLPVSVLQSRYLTHISKLLAVGIGLMVRRRRENGLSNRLLGS